MQTTRGTPLTPSDTPDTSGAVVPEPPADTGAADATPVDSSADHGGEDSNEYDGQQAQRRTASYLTIGLLAAVAVVVFVADVVSKVLVVARVHEGERIDVLGPVLHITLTRNPGAAFSIGTSMTFVFAGVAVAVIIAIVRSARRLRSLAWAVTLGLLLGGASGNLVDRIFRSPGALRGHVVDWLELPHWPVFNIADSAIVCGGLLAVLLALRGIELDGRSTADQAAGSSDG